VHQLDNKVFDVFISLEEGVTAEIYQHRQENITFLNLFLK
jgi:hypothetical protein